MIRCPVRLNRLIAVLVLATVFVTALPAVAQQAGRAPAAILSSHDVFHPVYGTNGMVASQKAEATRVGVEILKRGGNAVDAAVAVGFTLAVVLPRAGNLGGGGFMMIHLAESDETFALDYREMAPAGAGRDMYLDDEGEVDNRRARFSHLSVGVPGTVRGLAMALERHGTMSLAEVIAPAIELAEKGFPVTPDLAGNLATLRERFARWPASTSIFFDVASEPRRYGDVLVQKDLAWSLRQIAAEGPEAFYEGEIARRIAADMEKHDGLVTLDDLRGYRAVWREPLRGTYRGYEIVSMPPPSSGGVHVVQMLNILEGYPIGYLGAGSAETYHLMVEAMKHAFADRSRHLGDPDFWDVPVDRLTSKEYAAERRAEIDRFRTRPSEDIAPVELAMAAESENTTHFSVMDKDGNAVSNTYTLNFSYGTGIVAAGTGILLNNEMDDFSSKSGAPNGYGLIGGEANAIEPAKRPLSSMTPTFVMKDGKPYLVTGSPGGSRIITTVLQVVMNVLDHGMNVATATAAPRIHHQWLPDQIRVETGLSPDTLRLLTARGHHVIESSAMGSTQSILSTADGFFGAADPRRPDALALGY